MKDMKLHQLKYSGLILILALSNAVATDFNKENLCNYNDTTISTSPQKLDEFSIVNITYTYINNEFSDYCYNKIDSLEFIINDDLIYVRKWKEITDLGKNNQLISFSLKLYDQFWNNNQFLNIDFQLLSHFIVRNPSEEFQSPNHVRRSINTDYDENFFYTTQLNSKPDMVYRRLWQKPVKSSINIIDHAGIKLSDIIFSFYVNNVNDEYVVEYQREERYEDNSHSKNLN